MGCPDESLLDLNSWWRGQQGLLPVLVATLIISFLSVLCDWNQPPYVNPGPLISKTSASAHLVSGEQTALSQSAKDWKLSLSTSHGFCSPCNNLLLAFYFPKLCCLGVSLSVPWRWVSSAFSKPPTQWQRSKLKHCESNRELLETSLHAEKVCLQLNIFLLNIISSSFCLMIYGAYLNLHQNTNIPDQVS